MFSQPAAVCLRKPHPSAKHCIRSDLRFTAVGEIKPKGPKQNGGYNAQLPVDIYSLDIYQYII